MKKLYDDYQEQPNDLKESLSFEDYIKNKEDIVLGKDEKGIMSIIIPVEEDSFCHKMVKKYGEVLKEIEKLEARLDDLSLVEKYHKERLYNFKNNFAVFEYAP